MEMRELANMIFVSTIMLILVISICTYGIIKSREDTVYINTFSNDSINGISFGKIGYFVVTSGRTNEEIFKTDCHELTHQLINRDYEHFCGEKEEEPKK